jgi:hypothetical protein
MKNIIRIISLLACVADLICAYLFNMNTLYFASIPLLIGFLGTFVTIKKQPTGGGHNVSLEGGHFSKNTQTVNFAPAEKKENDSDI